MFYALFFSFIPFIATGKIEIISLNEPSSPDQRWNGTKTVCCRCGSNNQEGKGRTIHSEQQYTGLKGFIWTMNDLNLLLSQEQLRQPSVACCFSLSKWSVSTVLQDLLETKKAVSVSCWVISIQHSGLMWDVLQWQLTGIKRYQRLCVWHAHLHFLHVVCHRGVLKILPLLTALWLLHTAFCKLWPWKKEMAIKPCCCLLSLSEI